MSTNNMHRSAADVFWGEVAPCDHLLQIYEDESVFMDTLEGFIGGGLRAGDSAIIIATSAHIAALEERLKSAGLDLDAARLQDQYISLDAEKTLERFIADGWPDDQLFIDVITGIIARARKNDRKVRAFGEMVAILWGRGDQAATVRLEHLWHKLCEAEAFSVFCAYPKVGFTQNASESLSEICATHTRILPS